jgi:hypothetical protein
MCVETSMPAMSLAQMRVLAWLREHGGQCDKAKPEMEETTLNWLTPGGEREIVGEGADVQLHQLVAKADAPARQSLMAENPGHRRQSVEVVLPMRSAEPSEITRSAIPHPARDQ